MNRLPEAMIVVDPRREHIAVREAQRMGVAVVALIDTDSDPDVVDLPIPGNDDSIRSIELILAKLSDAVLEGRAALPADQQHLVKVRQPVGAGAGAPPSNGPNAPPPNPKPSSPVVQ
jgi:small subunit ribosomal protein S2